MRGDGGGWSSEYLIWGEYLFWRDNWICKNDVYVGGSW